MSDIDTKLEKAREALKGKATVDNLPVSIKAEIDPISIVKSIEELQEAYKSNDNKPVVTHLEAVKQAIEAIPATDTKAMEYALVGIQERLDRLNPEIKLNPVFKPKIDVDVPQAKIVTTDVYDTYKAADSFVPDNQTMHFHGFVRRDGGWFILRQSGDDTITYRYATPKNNKDMDYSKAWNLRDGLEYKRYDQISL